MKKTNKTISIICLYMLLGLAFVGHVFAAGPWKGRILDMDTGEPLEDAAIVAEWNKIKPGAGDTYEETFHVIEVVTDKDGYFEIPAYVPINLLPVVTRVEGPYFTIFKPGYLSLRNFSGNFLLPGATDKPDEKMALWPFHKYTTKTAANLIELPKLKSDEDRRKNIRLPLLDAKDIPNFLRLINQESVSLGLPPYPTNQGVSK